jgi:hypothetical protein
MDECVRVPAKDVMIERGRQLGENGVETWLEETAFVLTNFVINSWLEETVFVLTNFVITAFNLSTVYKTGLSRNL